MHDTDGRGLMPTVHLQLSNPNHHLSTRERRESAVTRRANPQPQENKGTQDCSKCWPLSLISAPIGMLLQKNKKTKLYKSDTVPSQPQWSVCKKTKLYKND